MQAEIQGIVDRALDDVKKPGRMDVITDLAHPLPGTIICEMLGVPLQDREQFKKWTDDLAGFWERTYPELRKELARRYPKHEWR